MDNLVLLLLSLVKESKAEKITHLYLRRNAKTIQKIPWHVRPLKVTHHPLQGDKGS